MDYQYLAHAQTIDNYTLSSMMDEYGNDVWNYAYFLTKSTEQADELSQEVFIRAYSGIAHFRGECSLKTWLLTITRNTTFTYRKSRFFRSSLWGETLPIPTEQVNTSMGEMKPEKWVHPSAEAEAISREHIHEIWDIIMALPDKFRELLLLHLKYELKTSEIAEMLGISAGTVKSRLSRAKAKVRKQWEERSE
ncbi:MULTISPECIES: RNA polymerase sigma factor [unclassified Paenibacillus]|uniref:RNA polymerase sigma factor n=1 Tax=unclassified Paenibacillus TaxID=185978 RepID=UPI000800B400|nr:MULTISPECIES: RNA polymerase sigma factor [unclassified Paenibacillus]OAX45188.1 ECF RNA polymerase sigma factor SigW [Paenibacillus sp. AD87]SDL67646.1 RNA polymerase sigma-70 factor, ECF subfamily [Paenibacillus sp. OK060]SLK07922.1 RNA polymerase sigma-70 factor, ECF subfamily [Paenibacillus sp. RU5A]SOC70869.1 RNA polymerase sigma-70 factor, ECF subfamily [Paenibacillus sp. RU26A]SOC73306.1 RNA polymerase sigma-70 factor, ECF subfamily [Paenibacillus sp. RU5M]